MNVYQRALRNLQDYSDDVSRSRHRTFKDAIRRFTSTLVPNTPLGDVVARLPHVDFHAWYAEQVATVGGMIGSGRLTWPDDGDERLAMQVELIRRLASDRLDILDFTTHFMWVRNDFNDNSAEFVAQVFRPFVRDFIRFAHDTPAFEAGLRDQTVTSGQDTPVSDDLVLFISHSAIDAPIAKAVIALFEKALRFRPARKCSN